MLLQPNETRRNQQHGNLAQQQQQQQQQPWGCDQRTLVFHQQKG